MADLAVQTRDELVQASWRRCRDKYGLERTVSNPILRLQDSEAQRRLERIRDNRGRIIREIDRAAAIVRRTGGLLVLADADKIVVNIAKNPALALRRSSGGITIGSCWEEKIAGTNGVHMGLLSGRPFTVRGSDHYYDTLKPFACTSVPILDAQEEVFASLTLSRIDRSQASDYTFAEQLVAATARHVHHALFLEEHASARIIQLDRIEAGVQDHLDGLLAIASDGRIVGCSSTAAKLLAVGDVSHLAFRQLEDVLDISLHDVEAGGVEASSVQSLMGQTVRVKSIDRERRSPASAIARPRTVVSRRRHQSLERLSHGHPRYRKQLVRAARMAECGAPIHIEGPPGSGKSTTIDAIIDAVDRDGVVLRLNGSVCQCGQTALAPEFLDRLRAESSLEALPLRTLVIENVQDLDQASQALLANLMEQLERTAVDRADAPARNLRLITSSLRPIAEVLRDDLATHLSSTVVSVPALHGRPDFRHLLHSLADRIAGQHVDLDPAAWDLLAAHDWTGNLREAVSVLREAIICGDGVRISPPDLPDHLKSDPVHSVAEATPYSEEQKVRDALATADWNVSLAARNLGVGRATLNRRIVQFGLVRPKRCPGGAQEEIVRSG